MLIPFGAETPWREENKKALAECLIYVAAERGVTEVNKKGDGIVNAEANDPARLIALAQTDSGWLHKVVSP